MSAAPRAALVSIGEELLEGRVTDTNAPVFATELLRRGFLVREMHTVGDAPGELRALLERLGGSFDLILSTGGLGPTVDDRVRAEVAGLLGVPLEAVPDATAPLAELYRRHHQDEPPPWFLAQAQVPLGAAPLANRAGTAWAFACELGGGGHLMCLPGPPRECEAAFHDGGGVEYLDARFPGGRELAFGTFHCSGAPESAIEAEVRDLLEHGTNPRMGITAGRGRVSLSVLAWSEAGRSAQTVLDGVAAELQRRLGELLWGRDEDSLEGVVVEELATRGQTVAVAESCTGGRIAAALTRVPGSSQVFQSGWTCYADVAKTRELGVPASLLAARGAVSAEVAEAMARGARARSGADWALATTGIAGPGGGSSDKPVGLVYLALDGPSGCRVLRRKQYARAGRGGVQGQTVRDALEALRREILGLSPLRDRD